MSTDGGDRSRLGELRHRIRYRFDNLLARGTWAALVWLGAVTFVTLVVSSVLLTIFGVTLAGSEEQSWIEDFWQTMLRALDTGTMAADVGWGRRVLALLVTIFGVLVAGTLIGIIAAGVEDRIGTMRRGRSAVIESGHIVILGGSDRLPVVVGQLVLANARRGGATIVVLSDQDPADLQESVRAVVHDLRGSRLVFRSGDPTQRSALGLVRLDHARAAIVLADAGGDAGAAKSVLAIGAELGGFDRLPVVVELVDPSEGERLTRACGGQVHTIVTSQAIARTAAFALRQPGLGRIVEELLDFRGCDLHVEERPDLTGLTFGSIVERFENARPIGRMRTDGSVELVPNPAAEFEPGERLILIADDLESLVTLPDATVGDTRRLAIPPEDLTPQRLLVVGWCRFGERLLANWASFAAPESTIDVYVDPDMCDVESITVPGFDRDKVTVSTERPTVAMSTTTVVLLGYSDRQSDEAADVRTLLELIELRRQLGALDRDPPNVLVQLVDAESSELLDSSTTDDYVISQAIGSQFIAQLAEQPQRRRVLLDLYAADGPSIRLVSAGRLGLDGRVGAADAFAVAYDAGMIAIGWRRRTEAGIELRLNPVATEVVDLSAADEIVVIG